MYRSMRFFALLLVLTVATAVVAFGQVEFALPISVQGVDPNVDTASLYFGVHNPNTPGADEDPSFGPPGEWGELAEPPAPPEPYDFRAYWQESRTSLEGTQIWNYQPYTGVGQVVEFVLRVWGVNPANGPLNLTWNQSAIFSSSDACVLMKRMSPTTWTQVADMRAVGSYEDPNVAYSSDLRYAIVLTNPKMVVAGPCFAAPTSVDFGTTTTQNIVVNNGGTTNATTISSVVASADYSVSPASATIPAGGSQTFVVTFTPPATPGTYPGTVVFTHNGVALCSPTSPTTITLSATVAAPGIAVSPASVDFGTVPNNAVVTQTVTITNTGASLPVTVSSSDAAAPFSIIGLPVTIPASGSATVTVQFNPTAPGVYSQSIVIGTGVTATLAVAGTASAQFGRLEIVNDANVAAFDVLDNSIDGDGYYTAKIRLVEYAGEPLKSVQLTLINEGVVNMFQLVKAAAVAGWRLDQLVTHSTQLPDGSTRDSINIVLWSLNAENLTVPAPVDLLTFGFNVPNITVDNASTSFTIHSIIGATADFTNAQLVGSATSVVNITNRTIAGDVNNDDQVNITDLLMIVDHITGKAIIPPGNSFDAADIAPWPAGDGSINVMDLALLQNIILTGQYPDGNPISKTASLAKASEGQVIFYVSPKGVQVEAGEEVKAIEFVLTDVKSSTKSGEGWMVRADNTLKGVLYHTNGAMFSKGIVGDLLLAIDNAAAVKAGEVLIAREDNSTSIAKGIVILGESSIAPREFSLKQNYPNPFNPSTIITVAVPQTSDVRVVVYNMLGQEVRTLFAGQMEQGTKQLTFDGKDQSGRTLASGTYIYRMTAGSFVQTMKMMLVK